MKKNIYITLTLCVLIVFLSSCTNSLLPAATTNSMSIFNTDEIDGLTTTFLSYSYECENILKVGSPHTNAYEQVVYFTEDAKQEVNIELLGEEYVGIYFNTYELPYSDSVLDAYNLKGTEKSWVFIDRNTNKIVECTIPYAKGSLKNEKDYISFIANMLESGESLSEYNSFLCSSYYSEIQDKSVHVTHTDSFKEPGEYKENEHHIFYMFVYEKLFEGLVLPDIVSFQFFDDSFHMEVYELNYDQETIQTLSENSKQVNKNVEAYISNNLKEEIKILNIEHQNQHAYIKNGQCCYETLSTITFISSKNETPRTVDIKTLTTN